MKCMNCGATLRSTRENYRDREMGLSNVVLNNIEIRRCPDCGEEEVVIPAVRRLHKAVALFLIEKPTRLNAEEIRFLRTYLNWASAEFAANFGVEVATVSRWEHGKLNMSPQADRLLRLAIVHSEGQSPESYPIAKLRTVANGAPQPLTLKLRQKKESWELVKAS